MNKLGNTGNAVRAAECCLMRNTMLTAFSLLVALFALSLFPGTPAQSQARPPQDASTPVAIGRWMARFARGGLYLDFDGVPLIKGGLVQVFAKDYARGYYGSGSNPPAATVETLPDGGRAYLANFHHAGEGYTFRATQRIEVHPQNTVTFTLRTRWDGPDTALLEWNAARLWAYPLVGATYEADRGDNVVLASGKIGLRPHGAKYPESRLAPPLKHLALRHTALGDISLTGLDDKDGPVVFDGRADQYLKDDKVFWCGYLGVEMPPDQETVHTITLTLTPRNAAPPLPPGATASPAPETPAVQTVAIPDARRPEPPLLDAGGHPLIIPQPKQAAFPSGDFPLQGSLRFYTALPQDATGRRVNAALHDLLDDLHRDTGTQWLPGSDAWNGSGLLVAVAGSDKSAQQWLDANHLAAPTQAEGYALRVTPRYVAVIGRDAAGAFYGLQTLRQLLRVTPQKTFAFAGADIADWPSLHFRGAHIFVGRNALPFHRKLIDRIFARYKLNAMVIECEYTRWKSHPEIHVPYSMSPEDLRADVAYARDHFLEPIPLVNSLGHSEWIFKNGQHLDLAEDVSAPHAYDASNPKSYRFIFDIYQEALDIFRPRLFHIGHDEVKILGDDVFGKYPARPENIRKGITKLFTDDTNRLADWLRARGVRTMLWGDMLLDRSEAPEAANAPTPEEAQKRRALLPNDAVIADWRYTPGSEQRNGLQVFKQAGFATLGCPWFEPENIRGWAQQAIQKGALGLLQTTWAGYDSNEDLLNTELRQFAAFVLAAEYAWSGTPLHPREPGKPAAEDALPYDAAVVFTRAYRAVPPLASPKPGWYLSLRRAANITLFGQGPDALPISAYPQTVSDVNSETLDIPLSPSQYPTVADTGIRVAGTSLGGVMLAGAINPATLPGLGGDVAMHYPQAISLPVQARAESLAFLHATAFGVDAGTRVGTYMVIYADGQKVEIPLRYGSEIRALDDSAPSAYTTSALSWGNPSAPRTLRLLRWSNPRPQVAIARLEFRADNPCAAPILFSVTGQ